MIQDLTDKQAVFNLVASAIIKQGGASALVTTDGVVCQYRGPNGRKCAAGHLIPDSDYKPEFEGKSVLSVALDVFRNGRELLHKLQLAHDDAAEAALQNGKIDDAVFMEKWRRRMEQVAQDFRLDPKAVQA